YQRRPIYFCDVVVRRDSAIRSFADLRGRSYAYNDAGSHSGYSMPRDHLLRLGETRGFFRRAVASGSHGASSQLVVDGHVDAWGIAGTGLETGPKLGPGLDRPLRVIESTGPPPIPPAVVSTRLAEDAKARLRETFLRMHEDDEGRRILAAGLIERFVPVGDGD